MQFGLDRAADESRSLAQNRDRNFVGLRRRIEQFFFGQTAVVPKRLQLEAVDLRTLGREVARHGMRQRQIDVIAAQQNVLPDGDAFEIQLARFFGNGDEREVGRAAADIDDQYEIAGLDAMAPVGVAVDPCVKRRLRLFQHGDVAKPGGLGGAPGQLARDGVERCRHGDQHFLPIERRVGMLVIPGGAEMAQIFGGGVQRRDALESFGRLPGKHGGRAVDRGIRQPALGGRDQAARYLGAAALARACRRRNAARRPTAGRSTPPGNRARPEYREKTATAARPQSHSRSRAEERERDERQPVREPRQTPSRSWWCRGRCRSSSAATATPLRFQPARARPNPDASSAKAASRWWPSIRDDAARRTPACRRRARCRLYFTSAAFPSGGVARLPSMASITGAGAKWRTMMSRALSCTSRAAAPTCSSE